MQRRSASRRRSTVSKPPFYRNKRIIAIGAAGVALVSLLAVHADLGREHPAAAPSVAARQLRSGDRDRQCAGHRQPFRARVPRVRPAKKTPDRRRPEGGRGSGHRPDRRPRSMAAFRTAARSPTRSMTVRRRNGGRWHRPAGDAIGRGHPGAPAGGDGHDGRHPSDGGTAAVCGRPTSLPDGHGLGPPRWRSSATTAASSQLPPHTGFQDGNRCVSTEFGEVGTADKNPTLLITAAPRASGSASSSTSGQHPQPGPRPVPRGRAGRLLQGELVPHRRRAWSAATSTPRAGCCHVDHAGARRPHPVPAFFVATEDGGGGADARHVTINVPGMPSAGTAQCASWAGDGSHRIPMMQRANQIPAFDSVRITVQ